MERFPLSNSPADALVAEGFAALDTGNFQSAHNKLQQVMQNEPRHGGAWFGLALLFETLGNAEQAMTAYQRTVDCAPGFLPAYLCAGQLLGRLGQPMMGLRAVRECLRRGYQAADATLVLAWLISAAGPTLVAQGDPQLERDLLYCLAAPDLDHQQLARVTAQYLRQKYQLDNQTNAADLLAIIATDDLWLAYLARVINLDPAIETLLTRVRRQLLIAGELDPGNVGLAAALALQCFANEYVFVIDEAESNLLSATSLANSHNCLLLAMYRPLDEDATRSLPDHPLVAELVQKTLLDLAEEKRLRQQIPSFSPALHDQVSQAVRSQYEQNPYPRWQAPPAPARRSVRHQLEALPGFNAQIFPGSYIELLSAGCGTGFEPIDIKRKDPSLKVTAIDLSVSSLSYAMRMANRLGVADIDFRQGDILDVERLGKQFNLVISTGVLHHMADPIAGWRSLAGVVPPGGVMRIALYSERARKLVVAARERIAALGLSGEAADIRRFRQQLLAGDFGPELARLAESDDFYSLSACRDLLFHIQEHRFTFAQIAEISEDLGLSFIGQDLPGPWVMDDFRSLFPLPDAASDLRKWDEFERRHPETFAGMYHLWFQKPLGF